MSKLPYIIGGTAAAAVGGYFVWRRVRYPLASGYRPIPEGAVVPGSLNSPTSDSIQVSPRGRVELRKPDAEFIMQALASHDGPRLVAPSKYDGTAAAQDTKAISVQPKPSSQPVVLELRYGGLWTDETAAKQIAQAASNGWNVYIDVPYVNPQFHLFDAPHRKVTFQDGATVLFTIPEITEMHPVDGVPFQYGEGGLHDYALLVAAEPSKLLKQALSAASGYSRSFRLVK